MKATGIFVTEEERQQVVTARDVSGMYLSGGLPMGDPATLVAHLCEKYSVPTGAGFNTKDGQFYLP